VRAEAESVEVPLHRLVVRAAVAGAVAGVVGVAAYLGVALVDAPRGVSLRPEGFAFPFVRWAGFGVALVLVDPLLRRLRGGRRVGLALAAAAVATLAGVAAGSAAVEFLRGQGTRFAWGAGAGAAGALFEGGALHRSLGAWLDGSVPLVGLGLARAADARRTLLERVMLATGAGVVAWVLWLPLVSRPLGPYGWGGGVVKGLIFVLPAAALPLALAAGEAVERRLGREPERA